LGLNEQPSVRRALPPVGVQSMVEQSLQTTTVCACENTVVMIKQSEHRTSMKYEFGDCTNRFSLYFLFSSSLEGWSISFTMVNK